DLARREDVRNNSLLAAGWGRLWRITMDYRSRRAVAVVAAVSAVGLIAGIAGANRYVGGGLWHAIDSWEFGLIPGSDETAEFPGDQSGAVSLGGGAIVDSVHFQSGSTGY